MDKNSLIFVAGHRGLAGSAIYRELKRKDYRRIAFKTRQELDLRVGHTVDRFFKLARPDYVFLAAAHAGGVQEAISKPSELLADNILIATNVINASHKYGVKKLMNMASSCVYPLNGKQPYTEDQIGDGKTDENWSYAIAKIAAIELCRAYHRQYGHNFMTVVPCNLYGINDKFGSNSHVIPALLKKFDTADTVDVWGDGTPRREFLYSDDMAKACVMLMEKHDYKDLHDGIVNIGTGTDISISELAFMIGRIVIGEKPQRIYHDETKPNGVPDKLMDVSLIKSLGWQPEISLEEGIENVYKWYKEQREGKG